MIEIEKVSEDQALMKEFVKSLSKQYDEEYFLTKTKSKEFPNEVWNDLAKNGYLGMIVPEKYGGGEFKVDDLRVFLREMAKYKLISLQFVSQIIVSNILSKWSNEEQRKKYLPQLISGTRFSFAITEPNEGADISDIKTTAVEEEGYYRLNGHKIFITGAKESKYMLVATRVIPKDVKGDNKRMNINLFLVDSDCDGINMMLQDVGVTTAGDMLITGDRQYDVRFNDVIVPSENMVCRDGTKNTYLLDISNLLNIIMAAIAIGWGENVLTKGVEYAKQRVLYEEPIGAYQGIQHPMVRARTSLELANLMAQRAARAYDAEEDLELVEIYVNAAKFSASEAANEACNIAMQSHGGYCVDRGYGLITLLPLIRLTRHIPISNEIILDRFGKYLLGST